MRTKPNDWFDPASKRVAYGVDVLVENEWCHDADETGKPRLYATPEARDRRRAVLRKALPEDGQVGLDPAFCQNPNK